MPEYRTQAKVRYFQIPVCGQEEIFRFQVSMGNAFVVYKALQLSLHTALDKVKLTRPDAICAK